MNLPHFPEMFSKRFMKSLVYGHIRRKDFKTIHTYCLFIGYQRSGHSLIGALIDAHPHAAMGMEVDTLHLVESGYGRNQIFYCLVRNSEVFTKSLGNIWTNYTYRVPGQFQGSYKELKVIGDKKGGKSTLRLGKDYSLYDRLSELAGCRIRVLHVIRHPLDNISTMVIRHTPPGSIPGHADILEKIDYYFNKVEINDHLRKSGKIDYLDIWHEDFVDQPEQQLIRIMEFIGLEPFPDYISACSSIIYREPRKSRFGLQWPPDLERFVYDKAKTYDFLKKYCL
jgi:hypothetical protein